MYKTKIDRILDKYTGIYYSIDLMSEDYSIFSSRLKKYNTTRSIPTAKIYPIQGSAFAPTAYAVGKDGRLIYNRDSMLNISLRSTEHLNSTYFNS